MRCLSLPTPTPSANQTLARMNLFVQQELTPALSMAHDIMTVRGELDFWYWTEVYHIPGRHSGVSRYPSVREARRLIFEFEPPLPKCPSRTPIGSTALDAAYRKVSSHIAGSSQPLGTKTTVYLRVQIGRFGFCLISFCTLLLRCGIKSFPRPGIAGGGSTTPNVDNDPRWSQKTFVRSRCKGRQNTVR